MDNSKDLFDKKIIECSNNSNYTLARKLGDNDFSKGRFYHPTHLLIDSQESLYIVDEYTFPIFKFSKKGSFICQIAKDNENEFTPCLFGRQIVGMSIDSKDKIYVAENERILRFSRDGMFLGYMGMTHGNTKRKQIKTIAVDLLDNLYVLDLVEKNDKEYDRFLRFSGNNKLELETIQPHENGLFRRLFSKLTSNQSRLFGLEHLVVDSVHHCYYGISSNSVLKFSDNFEVIGKMGSYFSYDKKIDGPFALSVDSKGYLYVTSCHNNKIFKYDPKGEFVTSWGSEGNRNGYLSNPKGIAVGNDYVYVADSQNRRIQKFTSSGKYILNLGDEYGRNHIMSSPSDVAVTDDGTVFIADTNNNRILKVTTDGIYESIVSISGPLRVDVDKLGNIITISEETISKFNSHGHEINKWTMSYAAGESSAYYTPKDIVTDSKCNAYFIHDGINKIGTNNLFSLLNTDLKFDSILKDPQYIAIDSQDNVCIIGQNNFCRFNSRGKFLTNWPLSMDGENPYISDIAIDKYFNVYVLNNLINTITKYSSTGEIIDNIYVKRDRGRILSGLTGMAVDGSERVYIVDNHNHCLDIYEDNSYSSKIPY